MLIGLRKALRWLLPVVLRQMLALGRRSVSDRIGGVAGRIARGRGAEFDRSMQLAVSQPIRTSQLWQGKLANLRLGAALLDGAQVEPGQIFSFWAFIGQPLAKRGFAIGRGIRADVAGGDIGGGLCQLSGIVYELGLRGGLSVVERHAHSRDLYEREEDRFTPLGLDATVVWPWKDLRLENRLGVPVMLRVSVEGMVLKAWLLSAEALPEPPLRIERSDLPGRRRVRVYRGEVRVSDDSYAL